MNIVKHSTTESKAWWNSRTCGIHRSREFGHFPWFTVIYHICSASVLKFINFWC